MRSPPRARIPAIATTEETARALRADAARNRERIIAAAKEVFAEQGLEASTAEIAHRAGVGEATLFRRFHSKDDLIDAVIEAAMDDVIASLEEALDQPYPGTAFERWLHHVVGEYTADQGFSEAAKERCLINEALAERRIRTFDLMEELLRRAQEVGAVRTDLTAQDVSFLVGAAARAATVPLPGLRPDLWKRYLGLIIDGMRPEGASRLRPGSPPRRLFEHPER
jgi:AcrR family transcriptional regulator